MAGRGKKFWHKLLQIILWIFAVFFILGGIGSVSKSSVEAILMIVLGLLLLPPVWRALVKLNPQIFRRAVRVVGCLVLFGAAVAVAPKESTPPPAERVMVSQVQEVQPSSEKARSAKNDKAQKITAIKQEKQPIVYGTGLADTEYELKFSHSPSVNVRTNEKGEFSQSLPDSTQVFGKVELARDVNGVWFGGLETYDAKYFSLQQGSAILGDGVVPPVVLGIGGGKAYEMSGYYMPGTTLLLKAGNKELSKAKVDKSGRFQLNNISLSTNYPEVYLYEEVSTGWFTSKEERRGDAKYLDIKAHKVLAQLPVAEVEESKSESIPYSSRTIVNKQMTKGTTNVTQSGVNGENRLVYKVTYRGNDEIKRELLRTEVTKKPVEQITTEGTYEAPPQKQSIRSAPSTQAPKSSSNGRTGAICSDGTHSNATGRGACSHHGGVSQWLY